jgi:hypothetical protein
METLAKGDIRGDALVGIDPLEEGSEPLLHLRARVADAFFEGVIDWKAIPNVNGKISEYPRKLRLEKAVIAVKGLPELDDDHPIENSKDQKESEGGIALMESKKNVEGSS